MKLKGKQSPGISSARLYAKTRRLSATYEGKEPGPKRAKGKC